MSVVAVEERERGVAKAHRGWKGEGRVVYKSGDDDDDDECVREIRPLILGRRRRGGRDVRSGQYFLLPSFLPRRLKADAGMSVRSKD